MGLVFPKGSFIHNEGSLIAENILFYELFYVHKKLFSLKLILRIYFYIFHSTIELEMFFIFQRHVNDYKGERNMTRGYNKVKRGTRY